MEYPKSWTAYIMKDPVLFIKMNDLGGYPMDWKLYEAIIFRAPKKTLATALLSCSVDSEASGERVRPQGRPTWGLATCEGN